MLREKPTEVPKQFTNLPRDPQEAAFLIGTRQDSKIDFQRYLAALQVEKQEIRNSLELVSDELEMTDPGEKRKEDLIRQRSTLESRIKEIESDEKVYMAASAHIDAELRELNQFLFTGKKPL